MFDLRALIAGAVDQKSGAALDDAEFKAAVIELCERGLLTCTRGRPGDDGAAYALAWLPLDNPDDYPADVRRQHAENLRKFTTEETP
jgi:hypothetical protein